MAIEIDFGIVTAIECERKELLGLLRQHSKKVRRVRGKKPDIRDYWRVKLPLADGIAYELVIVQCIQAGSEDAGQAAKDLIIRWKPARIVMVGVAGGYPRGDLRIGDVVIATEIIEYDYRRVHDGESEPRPRHHSCCPTLLAKLTSLLPWNPSDVPILSGTDGARPPKLQKPGPIAVGNTLFADAHERDRLLEMQQDFLAVEMESGGIAVAAWQLQPPIPVFVVRGICDLADTETKGTMPASHASDRFGREQQKAERQTIAACAAASFLIHMLRDQPVEPVNPAPTTRSMDEFTIKIAIKGNDAKDIPHLMASLTKAFQEIPGCRTMTITNWK